MDDKTDSVPKGAAKTAVASSCREMVLPSLPSSGHMARTANISASSSVNPVLPSLTAVGVSDDHYRTEDLKMHQRSDATLKLGSTPASTALAFIAST